VRGPSGNRPRERSNTSGGGLVAQLDIEGGDLAAGGPLPAGELLTGNIGSLRELAATKSASCSLRTYTSILYYYYARRTRCTACAYAHQGARARRGASGSCPHWLPQRAPVLGRRSSASPDRVAGARFGFVKSFVDGDSRQCFALRARLPHRPTRELCSTSQCTFQIRSGIFPTQVVEQLPPALSVRPPRFIRSLRDLLAGSCAVLRCPLTYTAG
jgi:hypothetical protein